MSSVHKVSSHVLWKIEAFIEEDTRNIVALTDVAQWLSAHLRIKGSPVPF